MMKVVDNTGQFLTQVKKLESVEVFAGIPEGNAGRDDGPINNASIGYINEYGSTAASIPPRPFIHPGIVNARDGIKAKLEMAARDAFDGRDLRKGFHQAGMVASASILKEITNGSFEPLADATLADRRRHNFKGTKPLIRTGQLRKAINYVVRDK